MSTFLAVLGVILIVVLVVGLMGWVVHYCVDGTPTRKGIAWRITAALLGIAFIVTVAIEASPPSDNSRHCGPGTEYVSKFNAATKTTDWMCVR